MVKKIKELCKKQGISISKLEKQAGIGNGTIGKWEKFSRRPKYEYLKAIANVLGVSVSVLAGEEQEESPPQSGEQLITMQNIGGFLDDLDQDQLKQVLDMAMKKFMEGNK